MALVSWRLGDLHPVWIATRPGRKGMGVRFLCPEHHPSRGGDGHTLDIWFQNPTDGGLPAPFSPHAWRSGDNQEDLTLALEGQIGSPFDFGVHGRFWVMLGEVVLASLSLA